MTIYKQWDVVVVHFPFVDTPKAKSRPALVLSDFQFNEKGLIILSMITTKKSVSRYMDTIILDIKSAGVTKPSIVRWKVFTLDSRIVKRKIGRLASDDISNCKKALRSVFSI